MIAFPFLLNSLANFAAALLVARYLGPGEFGHYAVALAAAIVVQTLAFDWLRLCATRFYSEKDRLAHPETRATLNAAFVGLTALFACAILALLLPGPDLPVSRTLAALALAAAAANGWFDYFAALARARFDSRAYATMVLAKTLLVLVLSVGGAFVFKSAGIALAGLILSAGGSVAVARRRLRDSGAPLSRAQRPLALHYAAYGIPIVLANGLYLIVPAADRGLLSQLHGFAQAGQLALAFDTGIRIIGAIGSVIDALMFQIAVLAERTLGAEAARRQVARNMGLQIAILVPAVAGCWIVLPSFEALFVSESFRGPFAHDFTLLLPAFLCFALSNYCAGPAFQIAKRTMPLIIGGAVAAAVNGAALWLLPETADATNFALAQSLSSLAGLAVLTGYLFTLEPMWPDLGDIAGTLTGTAAMVLVSMPLRTLPHGALLLGAQAVLGAIAYAVVVLAFDVAKLRTMAFAALAQRFAGPPVESTK